MIDLVPYGNKRRLDAFDMIVRINFNSFFNVAAGKFVSVSAT